MDTKGMKRLIGEELLVMRVLGLVSLKSIDAELDQRALAGAPAASRRRRVQRRHVLMSAA
ncbi:MAG: hypothetical protein LLG01_00330 [Planctomycetaceae bacterium]|nr:hypothetical protein [Planctomycetaceae bacterium]